jgi:hypothetical protein
VQSYREWEVVRLSIARPFASSAGYVEDYETVNLSNPSLNETEAEELYRELASGAESYVISVSFPLLIDLELTSNTLLPQWLGLLESIHEGSSGQHL